MRRRRRRRGQPGQAPAGQAAVEQHAVAPNENAPRSPQPPAAPGEGRGPHPQSQRPAGLTRALGAEVERDVRQRGKAYFLQGRVQEPKTTPEHFSAEVRGKGGNYLVTMDLGFDAERKRNLVNALCNCPFYGEGRGCCKHIWAALCLADDMPACEFKPLHGFPVSLKTRTAPAPRVTTVVSVDPSAAGRIRAFSAGDHASFSAPKETPRRAANNNPTRGGRGNQVSWREAMKLIAHSQREIADLQQRAASPTPAADVHFVIDVEATKKHEQLTVQLVRVVATGAGPTPVQQLASAVDLRALNSISPGADREVLGWFFGVTSSLVARPGVPADGTVPLRSRGASFVVDETLRAQIVERMAKTGRLGWLADDDGFRPLVWDGDGTWPFHLVVSVNRNDRSWHVRGEFRRGRHTVPLTDALVAFPDGLSIFKERVVRIDMPDARMCGWITGMQQVGTIRVEKADQAAFVRTIVGQPGAPHLDLPSDSGWTIVTGEPKPRLIFLSGNQMPGVMTANYEFAYETPVVPPPEADARPQARARGRTGRSKLPAAVAPAEGAMTAAAVDSTAGAEPVVEETGAASAKTPVNGTARRIAGTATARATAAAAFATKTAGTEAADASPVDTDSDDDGAPGDADGNVAVVEPRAPAGAPAGARPRVAPPSDAAPQQQRVAVRRDRDRELSLIHDLCTRTGVHPSAGRTVAGADVFVDQATLPEIIGGLTENGWAIEAEGRKLRAGRSFSVDVKSGVDWLDLRARFDFGDGASAGLPRILEAIRAGKDRVQLDDGTVGLLPEAWLKNLEPILGMGQGGEGDDKLRFRASQGAFLDVLVSEAAEASLDEHFAEFRAKLAAFSGVREAEPHAGFVGQLRPYQQQGLGWLEFLDEFAWGGCLADDMGLGKTVQVLAHLHKRRRARQPAAGTTKKRADKTEKIGPSLIVAPTSLIHNWMEEAQRFTPDLKVYAHTGASRLRDVESLQEHDLVITSYGTMRSDVEMFAGTTFDYVVLDEAQAIKNESTQIAKSARALKASRRLAMSGTPVENRLAELGSIFRFLNPGMLDTAAGFAELFSANTSRLTPGKLQTVARALRPFILRRTKEQVLPELPGKTETTVYCVLEDAQRREYDELAAHYRDSLTKKIKKEGLGKSRMMVLEALLRLRQIACHPGLIDATRVAEPSAKLDLLEEQLDEALDSGRKALVFSQFTSMLAIVRARLDEKGIDYEYLDGSTRDRKERVENFQNNDKVRIFLISLKAGGTGLNLTAADYCFILDPWWNPASEAQAIDRAHRIGQKSHVFAYRLIARGTVEEKILELQAAKRKLVEGIIADDGDVLSEMTAKDLDFLLG